MSDFKLSEIKEILQNTTSEIEVIQKELSRDQGNISNQKIEKLKKSLDNSESALRKLKEIQVKPAIKSDDVQNLIDSILKARALKGNFNPAVLQAILSSLQNLNHNIGEIIIKDSDHKRGERVENVNHEKL